jgi:hypothetical protein
MQRPLFDETFANRKPFAQNYFAKPQAPPPTAIIRLADILHSKASRKQQRMRAR